MVAALAVPAALAKGQAAPAAQQGEMGMRDKLQSAVESLNLTEDQKSKVKDIFADAKANRLFSQAAN
jgi:Spy/CpxP family protein refolding chaperone